MVGTVLTHVRCSGVVYIVIFPKARCVSVAWTSAISQGRVHQNIAFSKGTSSFMDLGSFGCYCCHD